jgi:hypothetical protein
LQTPTRIGKRVLGAESIEDEEEDEKEDENEANCLPPIAF